MRRDALALLAIGALLSGCASKAITTPGTSPSSIAEVQDPVIQPRESPDLQIAFATEAGEYVYFRFGSADLNGEAVSMLSRQAEWLRARDHLHAIIAGSCDERGTREYNLALGAQRASAAKTALVGYGVAPERLMTISYDKDRPVDPASSEEAWARNRNAHTHLVESERTER
jgi:peptidoglycan-associated lipoprotein